MRAKHGELAGVEPYDHFFEVYDEFDQLKDRIFWDESSLKYERHRPAERSADVLELEEGLDDYHVFYYTVGGPVLFDENDVVAEIEEVTLGDQPVEQVIDDLEMSVKEEDTELSETSQFFRNLAEPSDFPGGVEGQVLQKTAVSAMRGISEQHRERIPPEVYMEG
ncbi:MAG: hypothetical protein ABEJ66_02205 [Candidatus Nanohaloarchaea archaeon]